MQLEENIHHVAFSGDWVKHVDGWSVESSATHCMSAVESSQKRGPGGRRGRKPSSMPEVKADGDLDVSNDFVWWRGGMLSKFIFQKGILAQTLVKKSARQGKIYCSTIVHFENIVASTTFYDNLFEHVI